MYAHLEIAYAVQQRLPPGYLAQRLLARLYETSCLVIQTPSISGNAIDRPIKARIQGAICITISSIGVKFILDLSVAVTRWALTPLACPDAIYVLVPVVRNSAFGALGLSALDTAPAGPAGFSPRPAPRPWGHPSTDHPAHPAPVALRDGPI